jgi:thiamine pyrophosphate-dependent acetolactate synthase large subunit-like protein
MRSRSSSHWGITFIGIRQGDSSNAHRAEAPDQIGPTLKRAFEIPGPVLIGIRADYRDNHKLFEKVHEDLLN